MRSLVSAFCGRLICVYFMDICIIEHHTVGVKQARFFTSGLKFAVPVFQCHTVCYIVLSLDVNKDIRKEYEQGFRNLSNAAQNLAKQSVELLMEKGLNYRRNWLREITAHRKYQESLKRKNKAPEEILAGPGLVWWNRNGKPSLEEYRAMGI